MWQESFKRKGTGISSFTGGGEGFFAFRTRILVSLVLRQESAIITCVKSTFEFIGDNSHIRSLGVKERLVTGPLITLIVLVFT